MSDEIPDFRIIAQEIVDDWGLENMGEAVIEHALEQAYAQGRSAKIIWPSKSDVRDYFEWTNNSTTVTPLLALEVYDWLRAKIDELNKGKGE